LNKLSAQSVTFQRFSVSPKFVVVVCSKCGQDSDNLLVCDSCHYIFPESPYDVDVDDGVQPHNASPGQDIESRERKNVQKLVILSNDEEQFLTFPLADAPEEEHIENPTTMVTDPSVKQTEITEIKKWINVSQRKRRASSSSRESSRESRGKVPSSPQAPLDQNVK
jgi:hypothetical protein